MLQLYKSNYVSDLLRNGGTISPIPLKDEMNNLFRGIYEDELKNSFDLYRKFFIKNELEGITSIQDCKIFLKQGFKCSDDFQIAIGNDFDVQLDITKFTGVEWHGLGVLSKKVNATDKSFSVKYQSPCTIKPGFLMKIFNHNYTVEIEVEEIFWDGLIAEIQCKTEIGRDFSDKETQVSSVLNLNEMKSFSSIFSVNSSGGFYDNNPVIHNSGVIAQIWHLQFKDTKNFMVYGSSLGDMGSGSIEEDFILKNEKGFLFCLEKDKWRGSWKPKDKLILTTNPAIKGIWVRSNIVPSDELKCNEVKVQFEGTVNRVEVKDEFVFKNGFIKTNEPEYSGFRFLEA